MRRQSDIIREKGVPSMTRDRVLIICVHNSARSQMAEAWLNLLCGDHFENSSAGLEAGVLNPACRSGHERSGNRYLTEKDANRLRPGKGGKDLLSCHHGL